MSFQASTITHSPLSSSQTDRERSEHLLIKKLLPLLILILMVHNLKNRRIRKPVDPATENPVKYGLAYTPAKMAELAEKGIPISSMTLDSQYYDGDSNPSFDYGIEDTRGVDISEVWEAEMDAKQSFVRGLRRDKEYYGN